MASRMKPGNELLFLALGGSGEIGMNVNLYGCEGKWLMVDLGMTFSGNEYPGVDLVFVEPYTDAVRSPADVDAAVTRYRLQGAAYALAVEHTVGKPVTEVRFVFTSGGAAVERAITDLRGAIADVMAVL